MPKFKRKQLVIVTVYDESIPGGEFPLLSRIREVYLGNNEGRYHVCTKYAKVKDVIFECEIVDADECIHEYDLEDDFNFHINGRARVQSLLEAAQLDPKFPQGESSSDESIGEGEGEASDVEEAGGQEDRVSNADAEANGDADDEADESDEANVEDIGQEGSQSDNEPSSDVNEEDDEEDEHHEEDDDGEEEDHQEDDDEDEDDEDEKEEEREDTEMHDLRSKNNTDEGLRDRDRDAEDRHAENQEEVREGQSPATWIQMAQADPVLQKCIPGLEYAIKFGFPSLQRLDRYRDSVSIVFWRLKTTPLLMDKGEMGLAKTYRRTPYYSNFRSLGLSKCNKTGPHIPIIVSSADEDEKRTGRAVPLDRRVHPFPHGYYGLCSDIIHKCVSDPFCSQTFSRYFRSVFEKRNEERFGSFVAFCEEVIVPCIIRIWTFEDLRRYGSVMTYMDVDKIICSCRAQMFTGLLRDMPNNSARLKKCGLARLVRDVSDIEWMKTMREVEDGLISCFVPDPLEVNALGSSAV
ncbi:hypothetical protein BJ508DRAFT_333677 [Ascobolus immersus RN42]|uniref:Uncharacterized protein n=1 Tax=Ascobolus immersus RN42 TaxID=1160509 RepID=A0A3N4HW06_ASCIM|nr:hypothetical protein BJ508DRAFT_333677 [Ascobolus immersus RN42]